MAGISTNPNSLIGLYKRPGVYIREVDRSSATTVIAPDGVISLVIGVSKKGPVNRPVKISSQTEFIRIFGDIDRNLQYKQSYFHRTCLNMLRSGPILALNLLITDPIRDTVEYKNFSCSSGFVNELVKTAPYESLYLKEDFWIRDPESFIFTADTGNNNVTDLLSFTNFSDKKITVWAFKSSIKGFDIPASTYYNSEDLIPTFVNKKSLISDYLIKVVVVQGDYTNNQELGSDPYWSKYFTSAGLKPSMINDFIFNEANVTVLGNYDVSLIPFFRDGNNRDLYIESVINADTDRTGLFCAYRADMLVGQVNKGYIDLIGNYIASSTLDPSNQLKSVKFLSYDEALTENISYSDVYLDQPTNTWGWQITSDPLQPSRQANYGNGFIKGLYASTPYVNTTGIFNFTYDSNAYCVYENATLPLDSTITTLTANTITSTAAKPFYRTDLVVIDNTGTIVTVQGSELSTSDLSSVAINASNDIYPGAPRLLNNDIVIGVIRVERGIITPSSGPVVADSVQNFTYYPIAIDNTGWLFPSVVCYNSTTNNILNLTFSYTQGQLVAQNVKGNRNLRFFNDFRSKIVLSNSLMLDAQGNKVNLSDCTVSINTNLMTLKSIDIIAPVGTNILNTASNPVIGSSTNRTINWVTFYSVDNEFLLGTASMTTKAGYTSTITNPYVYATEGVVGKASTFYHDYINGKINTLDFAYGLVGDFTFNFTQQTISSVLHNYIDIPNYSDVDGIINPTDVLYVSGSTDISKSLNSFYTVLSAGNVTISSVPTFRIEVLETVIPQTGITTKIYHKTQGKYIKTYTINGNLYVQFSPEDLSGIDPIQIPNLAEILVTSDKSNYKQTLEIETVITSNQISISADRYPELAIGDYIQALVDPTSLDILENEVGRAMTRIVDKVRDPNNQNNFIITTDAPIYYINALNSSSQSDLQTYAYMSFDKYITGYKGTAFKGFKISSASLPDGTEERQTQILQMVGKGTPMYKALADRNKVKWRYLVDSFGLGLTALSKQELVDLCGEKTSCLGFINAPSAKLFKQSTSPSFRNANGTLNYEWISKGGNPGANNAFRYSIGNGPGQSSVAYFYPWVYVTDNGQPLLVPPASYAASTYMQKFLSRSGNVYSYTVAAGITNGVISGITNLEVDLQTSDIEFLIDAGINTLTYKMDRDFVIETELTAQTIPQSSLSIIHCRELLIDLENELYNMLLPYQNQFNNAETRSEIKDAADQICQRYVDRNGLYAYNNIIDETNNTNELIDAQIGFLQTEIEITKAMGIIINEINILKTGGLSSTGFV